MYLDLDIIGAGVIAIIIFYFRYAIADIKPSFLL